MTTETKGRPHTAKATDKDIYSNFDDELHDEVVKIIKANPNKLYAQHSAWDFCGYVWYDGYKWKEEIWQWKFLVEVLEADTIEEIIDLANTEYGSE